jgi:FAD/FMN-containing dehydrogenase
MKHPGAVTVAGGFGQTASHGPFSSKYGLPADHFLEFNVVTADGNLRIANDAVNQDLFWALRGGGGGTFGIVVEATVHAFPTPKITVINWWINSTSETNPGLFDAAAYLHSQFPSINAKVFKAITAYTLTH